MRRPGGLVGKALDRVEETSGLTLVPAERIEVLEAYYEDYRVMNRQLESIGWSVLNYIGGRPHEQTPQHRLRVAQQARFVWMNDPQAGAAVELMNDFVFGRGVPRPRAKDDVVQMVIDEAWDDPDNSEVLTTIEAQLALGTDLAIQSNVFVLAFGLDDDEGDGIKLSILRHDDVTGYVPHPQKRHRVLYYLARERTEKWDYRQHQFRTDDPANIQITPRYYPHWRNVDLATEENGDLPEGEDPVELAPDALLGKGRVYHLRINRGSEDVFGISRFQRTLTWYTAYNKYVKDRLDIVAAAASLIMKRKIQGTPTQLARDAARAVSRQSPLAMAMDAERGPRAGGVVEENQSVTHEAFNLDTRAGNAQQDAQIIRAPISAAERFSQAYFGDTSSSNLATATSLELPILKAVEARQEVFERMIRWFIDRVIEKGVDAGKIPETLEPGEVEGDEPVATPLDRDPDEEMRQSVEEAARVELEQGWEIVEVARVHPKRRGELREDEVVLLVSEKDGEFHYTIVEGYEDQDQDEADTARDLGYEFSMPSPLRRMMSDLISSITQIAQTFDPNNTNPNLSRALLTIALGEGLEVQDAPDLVDEILPKGYVDPMVKAQLAQAASPMGQPDPGGEQFPSGPDGNPYGAPMNATRPEDQRSGAYAAQEAEVVTGVTRARDGSRIVWTRRRRQLGEHVADMPDAVRRDLDGDVEAEAASFQADVIDHALDQLDAERIVPSSNGKGG